MKQVYVVLSVVIAGLIIVGCATSKPPATTTTPSSKYSEDLSVWRPKTDPIATPTNTAGTQPDVRKQTAYVEPKYAVNKKLDNILDSIDYYNVKRNFIDGFTIQVYSGLKKEDALNAKKQIADAMPDLESDVQYSQPNFRVKVGKYFSRIDAQKDYTHIKKLFPTAIVIPDKVAIN
ncbi:MAG: SPOR domain-containing protein [Chryseolinea sp.]